MTNIMQSKDLKFPEDFRGIPGAFPGDFRGISGGFPGYAWVIPGGFLGIPWGFPAVYVTPYVKFLDAFQIVA